MLLPEEERPPAAASNAHAGAAEASAAMLAATGGASQPNPFHTISDANFASARSSPRRAYPYRQLVAALEVGVSPDQLSFTEVQFLDISAGGVSFRLETRPAFDMVVLALGVRPNVHYIRAKIVNVSPQEEGGRSVYHVGCRFLERLQT